MTGEAAILLAAFALLLAIPFALGALELRRRRDALPLDVSADNVRNPRQFSLAFRERLRPHLLADGAAPVRVLDVVLRRRERLEVHDAIRVAPGARRRGILAARAEAVIGEAAQVADVYAMGNALLGSRVRVRTVACDGSLVLGAECAVRRWIDGASVSVGTACDLGVSASAAASLRVSRGCVFTRLWGLPVETAGDVPPLRRRTQQREIRQEVLWARRRLSLPPRTVLEQNVVAYGDVEIGPESTIVGTIKAHGEVVVGQAVRIDGSVISRGPVRLERNVSVDGNVFAEGHVHLAPGVRVGSRTTVRSVYSSRELTIAPGVRVFGWVVAERRGRVL